MEILFWNVIIIFTVLAKWMGIWRDYDYDDYHNDDDDNSKMEGQGNPEPENEYITPEELHEP